MTHGEDERQSVGGIGRQHKLDTGERRGWKRKAGRAKEKSLGRFRLAFLAVVGRRSGKQVGSISALGKKKDTKAAEI
jgi:hypothetical protein